MTAASPARSATFDPIFDAQAAFRVLLDAMARPGAVASLGVADDACPVAGCGALAAIGRTLLDHEVGFAVVAGAASDEEASALARYLTGATGSRAVAAPEADFVFVLGTPPAGLLGQLRRGSPAFPDDGATVIILAPDLDGDSGMPVVLRGPGIAGEVSARLAGLTAATLAERDFANAEPPRGLDLVLADAAGRIRCLPRSTGVRTD